MGEAASNAPEPEDSKARGQPEPVLASHSAECALQEKSVPKCVAPIHCTGSSRGFSFFV